jgi:hypothetical protein
METHEYKPGDVVPVTSPLYRVVHDPPSEGEQLKTFYARDRFPRCLECDKKVRYVLPIRILKRHAARVIEERELPLPPEE